MLRFPEEAPRAFPPKLVRERQRPVVPSSPPAPAEEVALCAGTWGNTTGILTVTGGGIGLVSMLRGETQMWTVPIGDVFAVEENACGAKSDIMLLTVDREIVLTGVPRARAWAFCRHVRDLIRGA